MARIDQVLAGEKSWGAYALDVLGHAALGTAYALPFVIVAFFLGWGVGIQLAAGAVAALLGGVIREIVQHRKSHKLHLLDRALDAVHHLFGAPIALSLFYLVMLCFYL